MLVTFDLLLVAVNWRRFNFNSFGFIEYSKKQTFEILCY